MTRNTNTRFALNPTRIDMSRSKFDRSASYKTTFNVGDLIPFYVDEVLPGDTFSVDTSKVVRMQTLMAPIMDNIYLDFYFFFVPNRLTWSHWRELMGENSQSAWIPTVEYSVPQLLSPEGGWNVGTIADYMGIPTGVGNLSVNALPFRAYALICNEWFRDENLTDPLNIPVTDSNVTGVNTGNFITDVVKGGLPFKAAKFHDYFSSCLPSPQKGPDVSIDVATLDPMPVVPLDQFSSDLAAGVLPGTGPMRWATGPINYPASIRWQGPRTDLPGYPLGSVPGTDYNTEVHSGGIRTYFPSVGYLNGEGGVSFNDIGMAPANLWAVPSGQSTATAVTINQLRTAFQIQKMYERDARGGTRYIEILKSHFGVTSPDARLQRPEYLGGSRVPININQVVQNSETGSTPQGNTAAYSLTVDSHSDFTKSFVEHGFVLGLMVARYDHSYQQGLERFWSRKDRFDYYWPVFANLGEMAVLNKEIYAQGTDQDDEVFGYQEAWADYRYRPSRVTGEMRSQYAQSLDVWHLADDYSELPRLSDSWIRENSATVNRVISVSDKLANQLFCDIYVKCHATRAMPLYSIPGLVDHH